MKLGKLFTILMFSALLPFYSCGGSSETENTDSGNASDAPGAVDVPASDAGSGALSVPTDQPADAAATPSVPAAVAGTQQHYICPNSCEGSGGAAAGNCPTCGTAYVHNQSFHSQGGATPPPANANPATPPPPSPAQNTAGAYHYTCPKGCAGGSGTKGTCASCGGELAHNQSYHQQ